MFLVHRFLCFGSSQNTRRRILRTVSGVHKGSGGVTISCFSLASMNVAGFLKIPLYYKKKGDYFVAGQLGTNV